MKKNICLAQISIEEKNVEDNVKKIKSVISENADADLIVFPELILQGHRFSTAPRKEIEGILIKKPSKVNEELHKFAMEQKTRVIFGEMDEIDGKIYNMAVYVGRNKIERYAKTHIHWTETFTPGQELKTFDSSIDRIGVLICFDAAFPETSRALALQGAKTIVVISAIPAIFNINYEMIRLQAIAHNNQLFVVFVNRCGSGFSGNSAVINPRGEIIARMGKDEEHMRVEIDLREVEEWRNEESIYPNRRPKLYKAISEER
jgi:predicted amidohydrolase